MYGNTPFGFWVLTVKWITSPKDKKKFKAFHKHHQYHSGPHIDGIPAEDDTYDWDDENDVNRSYRFSFPRHSEPDQLK